jgi:hypothetical protein
VFAHGGRKRAPSIPTAPGSPPPEARSRPHSRARPHNPDELQTDHYDYTHQELLLQREPAQQETEFEDFQVKREETRNEPNTAKRSEEEVRSKDDVNSSIVLNAPAFSYFFAPLRISSMTSRKSTPSVLLAPSCTTRNDEQRYWHR